MPDPGYILASLGTILVVTFALRAVPFAILSRLRDRPIVEFLSLHMPVGILVILVVYTLRDVEILAGDHGAPEAIALASTIGVHLWRRNAVLSVIGGTILYIGLRALVFG